MTRVLSSMIVRPRTQIGGRRKNLRVLSSITARARTPPGVGTPLRASKRSTPPAKSGGAERNKADGRRPGQRHPQKRGILFESAKRRRSGRTGGRNTNRNYH